jgi:hypothetical protein
MQVLWTQRSEEMCVRVRLRRHKWQGDGECGHVRAAVAGIGPGQTIVQSRRECECNGEATASAAAVPQHKAGAAASRSSGVAAAVVR